LDQQLKNRNWEKLQYHSNKYWTINCNWKAYIDNYLDGGYHIPHMHPTLNAQLKMDGYQTDCFPKYSVQTSPGTDATDIGTGYDPSARIGAGSIYAWIYPSFMINLYGNCMDINYVIPVNENQCRVYYEFYFHTLEGEEQKSFIEESIKQSDITQIEDIEICESVQKGLQSGAYIAGRYAPRLEKGEHHFHQLLSQDLSNSK
jgi:choline monooxygenase